MYIDLIEMPFFNIIDVGSEHSMYNDADHGCVFVDSKKISFGSTVKYKGLTLSAKIMTIYILSG